MMELNIRKDQWIKVKLLDVFIKKEENDKENARNRFDRFLKVEHMDAESLHIKRWASQENGDELNPYFYKIFRKGQILFPTRNPHLRRTVLASFDGICGEKTLTLVPNEKYVAPEFIPFLFHSESFYAHTTGAIIGSTNPHVRWRDVANYEFLLPPKDQQVQLAELLWAMDEVIERENNLTNNLRILIITEIRKLFEIGKKKIQIKFLISKEKIIKAPIGNRPYIEIGDIFLENKTIVLKEKESVAGAVIAKKNSILVSKVRPNRGAITILKDSAVVSNGFSILEPNIEKVLPDYLFHCLAWNEYFLNLMSRLATGSTYPTISDEDILNYQIPSFSIEKQSILSRKYDKIYNSIIDLETKTANSKALQKSLINQIF